MSPYRRTAWDTMVRIMTSWTVIERHLVVCSFHFLSVFSSSFSGLFSVSHLRCLQFYTFSGRMNHAESFGINNDIIFGQEHLVNWSQKCEQQFDAEWGWATLGVLRGTDSPQKGADSHKSNKQTAKRSTDCGDQDPDRISTDPQTTCTALRVRCATYRHIQ